VRSTVAIAILLLAAGVAAAAGDHELLAAEQELKIAKDHLSAGGTEYGGHRREALRLIDQALREIREGINVSRQGGGTGTSPKKGKGGESPGESPGED